MQKLFKSFSTVFLLLIIVKLIDVSRNLIVAANLGVNNSADIYMGLITIPESLLIFMGFDSLKGVVNSEYSYIKDEEKKNIIGRSYSNLLRLVTILSIVCLSLLIIFRSNIIDILLPGFPPEKKELAVTISLIILPIFFPRALFNLIQPIFNSFKSYNLPTVLPVVISVCILVSLALPYLYGQILFNLAVANLLGNVILLIVLFVLSFRFISHLDFSGGWWDPLTKKVIKNCSTVFVLVVFNQAYLSSRNIFVSYYGEGALSSISYAANLPQFISTFIFSIVFGILLSELSSGILNNDKEENSKKYYNTFLSVLYMIFPVAILFIIYTNEVLSIVYLRGNFTQLDIFNISVPFQWEALSLITFVLSILPTALYLAYKKYLLLSQIGIVMYILGIFLNYYLTGVFGFYGVSIAGFITTGLFGVLLIIFSIKIIDGFREFVKKFFKILISAAFTFAIVYFANLYLGPIIPSQNFMDRIINVSIGALGIIIIYVFTTMALKIQYLQKFILQLKPGVK